MASQSYLQVLQQMSQSRQNNNTKSRSLTKLGAASRLNRDVSQSRNIRIKTLEKEHSSDISAMQSQLHDLGYSDSFLQTLFRLKCEDNLLKANEAKYATFLTGFYKKVTGSNRLTALDHNLKEPSLTFLLRHLPGTLTCLDLSSTRLPTAPILHVLENHPRLVEIALRNMNLQSEDLKVIFDTITRRQQIVSLDISNRGSDWLNRVSESWSLVEGLLGRNRTLMRLEMEGVNFKDRGIQALERAYRINNNPSLFYLNLRNNNLTRHSFSLIKTILLKGSLKDLDLSDNPMGDDGIEELGDLKNTQLMKLNLSNVGMESKGLIAFLDRLRDCKDLETLILDKNDFSNNWFIRIQEVIEDNKSIKDLRMVQCRIKFLQSLFEGLTGNIVLQKLNVSRNTLDGKFTQLVQLLRLNQSLKELRLRFCSLDAEVCRRICSSIQINHTLKILDLSENSIGSQVGRQLLSSLYMNNTLISLSLDKTQIDISTRKFMEEKLALNMIEHQKQEKLLLIRENQQIKQKDRERKENLEVLRDTVIEKDNKILKLKIEVEGLSSKYSQIKKRYQQMLNIYEMEVANLNKELMKVQVDARPLVKQWEGKVTTLNSKVEGAKNQKDIETKNVIRLEALLKSEKQRVRKVEDALEQQFQNEKYLKKKQSLSLPKLVQADGSPIKKSNAKVVCAKPSSKIQLKSK